MPVDLRTDFVSRPTEAMVAAMMEAARSPPAFGLREDPTVRRLEARAAERIGKEDALFCPTCTQANQIAIHLHCRPGEAFVAEASAHVVRSEAGAASALSGAMPRPVAGTRGAMAPMDVAAAIAAGDAQRSRTALVVVENTHVHSGGAVVPLETMCDIRAIAARAGVPVHLDGARLFNAATALGVDAQALAACADTVAFNLNKGLGAPIGAIFAGPCDLIEEAVRLRQMFGGGWRPAGILAAAGVVALDAMVDRLAEDHANARRLAGAIAAMPGIRIDGPVETNIVLAGVERSGLDAGTLAEALAAEGILVLPVDARTVRLVTHPDVGDAEIAATIAAFAAVLDAASQAARA